MRYKSPGLMDAFLKVEKYPFLILGDHQKFSEAGWRQSVGRKKNS
ncbi:MAG: hypothetical protein ACRCZW_00235 [Lactobacillaceae bacterium]